MIQGRQLLLLIPQIVHLRLQNAAMPHLQQCIQLLCTALLQRQLAEVISDICLFTSIVKVSQMNMSQHG